MTFILSAFDPTKEESHENVAASVILCLLVVGAVQSCLSPFYLKRIVQMSVSDFTSMTNVLVNILMDTRGSSTVM